MKITNKKPTNAPWAVDQINKLKELWNLGLTTRQIANILKISKNSVIGKAHRLHLTPRASPIKQGKKPDNVKPVVLPEWAKTLPPLPSDAKTLPPLPSDNDNVMQFTPPNHQPELRPKDPPKLSTKRTCQWIYNSHRAKEIYWCKKPSIQGKSWCEEHYKVVFQRPTWCEEVA